MPTAPPTGACRPVRCGPAEAEGLEWRNCGLELSHAPACAPVRDAEARAASVGDGGAAWAGVWRRQMPGATQSIVHCSCGWVMGHGSWEVSRINVDRKRSPESSPRCQCHRTLCHDLVITMVLLPGPSRMCGMCFPPLDCHLQRNRTVFSRLVRQP